MKITRNTTINKMFELGFTEMRFKQFIVGNNEDIFTLEDFKKNGRMYGFGNYSIDKFENAFCCVISFSL